MKRLIKFLVMILLNVPLIGQTPERKLVNATGKSYQAGSVMLSTSVGEPIVGILQHQSAQLSQGFFPGKFDIVIVPVEPSPDIVIYPNPFTNSIQIKGEMQTLRQLQLFNITGQRVATIPISSRNVIIQHLPRGVYVAKLIGLNGGLSGIFKLVKL